MGMATRVPRVASRVPAWTKRRCATLAGAGVPVPRALWAELRPDEAQPIESKFALLLEDFSPEAGWEQQGALGIEAARAALHTLAQLHAFFAEGSTVMTNPDVRAELEQSVWPAGADLLACSKRLAYAHVRVHFHACAVAPA